MDKYEKVTMLYEGKAKKVYSTADPDSYIIEYKDDATAFNAKKRGTIVGKGIVNNKMTAVIFTMLEQKGIPTHFIKMLDERNQLVKAVKILPLEVIVRNVAAGSLSKRLGVEEGSPLKCPVMELCYKCDALDDPMINDYHALALGYCTAEELEAVRKYTFMVNEALKEFFLKMNLRLIDFKIEFGTYHGEVILADEISPDSCRLWDVNTNEKMDKDRFRRDLGNVEETYQEVLQRMLDTNK